MIPLRVAQRVGRGIALLFHNRGTRRWVSGQQHAPAAFTPGKDPVPIVQGAGWAPGPVWTGGKSRRHRDSIPDRPGRSSVAISNELPGPQQYNSNNNNYIVMFDKTIKESYVIDVANISGYKQYSTITGGLQK